MWYHVAPGFRVRVSFRRMELWADTSNGPRHICNLDPVATTHACEDATLDFRGLDIEYEEQDGDPPDGPGARLFVFPGGRQG